MNLISIIPIDVMRTVHVIWACFLSLARSKLRLCSDNHRAGYFSNLACDWPSIVWAYCEHKTENGPWWLMLEWLCWSSLILGKALHCLEDPVPVFEICRYIIFKLIFDKDHLNNHVWCQVLSDIIEWPRVYITSNMDNTFLILKRVSQWLSTRLCWPWR